MDLKKTPTGRRRVGMTMVFALATIAVTLTGSGVAPLAAESVAAPAPVPLAASSATSSKQAPSPAEPVYMTIFTPRLTLPAAVKAPSSNEAAAFAALNALIDRETLFGDAIIGMRVSLDRAQAAASGGAQLWFVRQANASAEYALGASRLVGSFPALQSSVARAFVADKMSVTLTPAQFAAAKAKLLARLAVAVHSLARSGGGGLPALHGPRGRVVEGRHPRHEPHRAGIDAGRAQDLGAAGRAGVELGHRPGGPPGGSAEELCRQHFAAGGPIGARRGGGEARAQRQVLRQRGGGALEPRRDLGRGLARRHGCL